MVLIGPDDPQAIGVAVQDYRRIMDDKSIQMLVVATCNHWHAPAAILGCAAGKHVYVEKPCSYNPREGELMVQAARKHQKKVQMGNQRRSYSGVIAAIDTRAVGLAVVALLLRAPAAWPAAMAHREAILRLLADVQ